jgi:hypothetical protein
MGGVTTTTAPITISGDGTVAVPYEIGLDQTLTVTDKIVFSAEYAGAALEADGTNNLGFLTSDNAGSGNSWMNYYHWENTQTSGVANDYDIILRFTLPSDFSAWETNAIVIDYAGTSTANFTANVFIETGASQGSLALTSGGGLNNWAEATISGGALGAGDTGVIVFKMTAASSSTAGDSVIRLGDVTLNFTRLKY